MLYFAYGSNIDTSQMLYRCPDAEWIAVGSVTGRKFHINSRGVATIVPLQDGTVYGVLWELSAADERALDRYEGVARNLYQKQEVAVLLKDGQRANALVYLAVDEELGSPRAGYLEAIVAAARSAGFPPEYVQELNAWSMIGE